MILFVKFVEFVAVFYFAQMSFVGLLFAVQALAGIRQACSLKAELRTSQMSS